MKFKLLISLSFILSTTAIPYPPTGSSQSTDSGNDSKHSSLLQFPASKSGHQVEHNDEQFEFINVVSFKPKNTEQYHQTQGNLLSIQAGEDAYFMMKNAIGVADGVGGYGHFGTQSLWSRKTLHYIALELETNKNLSPLELLEKSYQQTLEDIKPLKSPGSTTVLFSLIDGDKLHIVNLGDSVLLVIRDGNILFRTTELQNGFNKPFSLGIDKYKDEINKPNESHIESISIKEGDLVIVGSDGIFDNVFDDKILQIVNSNRFKNSNNLQVVSDLVLKEAFDNSENKEINTPFQETVNKHKQELIKTGITGKGIHDMLGLNHKGGKKDDLTIVIGLIRSVSSKRMRKSE